MQIKLIYVTLPDRSIASSIAKILVQEKLAACVNILGALESFYIWEERLTQSNEILLIAKTTKRQEAKLILRVKELHPYECPGIVSLDIINGDSGFLQWIAKATS